MLTMYQEDKGISRDLKPSPELFEMIQAAASSLTGFAQLWESIRKKGTKEGFTETELQDLIKPLLKAQLHMSKEQIWYMFNKEKKALANKEAYETRRINPPIAVDKEPEQRSTTERPQDAEQYLGAPESMPKERDQISEIDYSLEKPEDPKDLEIQFLKEKVAELEEALKKTQQFVPATDINLQLNDPKGLIEKAVLTEEIVFDWLKKRDDGSGSFWYDSYGIDLFKTRQLPQLKNQGVKVFKRLFFEV